MGWWTTLSTAAVETVRAVAKPVNWLLDKSGSYTLGKKLLGAFIVPFSEVVALKYAVPALINHEQVKKLSKAALKLLVYDVAPVLAVNLANNQLQSQKPDDEEYERSMLQASLYILLSGVDYAVLAWTIRQGVQTSVRLAVINTVSPPLLNAVKTITPESPCDTEGCNELRRAKGEMRWFGIYFVNNLLVGAVSYVPNVGMQLSQLLEMVLAGDFIGGQVTPERCERHKQMSLDFILGHGFTYVYLKNKMNEQLSQAIGPLPLMYQRVFEQLLMLMFINIAAHQHVPIANPNEPDLIQMAFRFYERSWRAYFDVLWDGLLKKVPEYLLNTKDGQKFSPLSKIFRALTVVLNADIERAQTAPDSTAHAFFKKARKVAPPILQSARNLYKDPVVGNLTDDVRESALNGVQFIQRYGRSTLTNALSWAPDKTAFALKLQFGIPERLTIALLNLSRSEDFWRLIAAAEAFLLRHRISYSTQLISPSGSCLLGDRRCADEPPPAKNETTPITDVLPRAIEDKKHVVAKMPLTAVLPRRDSKEGLSMEQVAKPVSTAVVASKLGLYAGPVSMSGLQAQRDTSGLSISALQKGGSDKTPTTRM